MKHKTISAYLTLFLGMLGADYWYLNKSKILALLHASVTIISILAIFLYSQGYTNTFIWAAFSLGMLTWCYTWLKAIVYALMPEDKWLNYTANNTQLKKIHAAQTNALGVICVIIALMIGMGSLMAFLSFALQSYYE